MDAREMFRRLPWPYPGGSFPPQLGAVVMRTVAHGDRPALEVTHWADGSWTVGDGIDDPNLPDALTVVHMAHVVGFDSSVSTLAVMPPGHIALRRAPGEAWQILVHDDSDD